MSLVARLKSLVTRTAPPLTDAQRALLERELPFLAAMPANDRARFDDHVRKFLARKRFEGVGIDVTDEMRLVIAGCAARLSRNIGFGIYDRIGSIVLYPGSVRVAQGALAGAHGDGPPPAGDVEALGVHHSVGTIVLSWPAVQQGLRNGNDGHDTALHELAHALDAADGGTDGTPPLGVTSSREWARVFSRRFLEMKKRPSTNVMRSYGATNEAEFFAVASETFFEKPNAMKRKTPDLYEQLREYYGIDPAAELARL